MKFTHPNSEAMSILASIPLIESHYVPRMQILHVARNAFMDAPTVPALVMHPIDYRSLQVAVERDQRWHDIDTQFEGVRRYIEERIEKRAARALRKIDRLAAADRRP